MTSAAFDANALVSGFAGSRIPGSTSGELLRQWQGGSFVLVVSPHVLNEVERTLRKPFYRSRLTDRQVAWSLNLLRTEAQIVTITAPIAGVAIHPEDDLVLATAVSAGVPYLVTGDRQLLSLGAHEGVTIISPRAFLDLLTGADPAE